jgi:DNA-binding MarR family transcriptional regulator
MNSQFDTILHQSVRGKLIKLLIENEQLPVKVLKEKLKLTDGNLSSHLKKLEVAEYIKIEKSFEVKRPKTMVTITQKGEDAYKEYLQQLKAFVAEYEKYKED